MAKSRYHLLVIVQLLISFNAWSSNSNTSTVLIFDHIPSYIRSVFPLPEMKWVDNKSQITIFDHFYEYGFNPKPLVADTIIFYPQNDNIILSFSYAIGHEPLIYLIAKGDTIVFSFVDGIPYGRNKKDLHTNLLNYEYNRLNAKRTIKQYTPYEIYRSPILVAKNMNEALNNYPKVREEYYDSARLFLNNELSFLNNFKEIKNSSPDIFNFFQDKLKYELATLDFEQHKLNTNDLHALLELNKKGFPNLSYSYFLPFLEVVSDSINVKASKLISYNTGSEIDFRDVYDRTNSWNPINDFYKKQLLYKYLKKIGEIFSASDLKLYISKFSSFTNDTLLVKEIKNEFLIYYDSALLDKNSLSIADFKSNTSSLQTFLNKNKGKVIYIDFWASWCLPCRVEMKKSKETREIFKNKDVVFAYFSIDKNKNEWIEASNQEKLDVVQDNYILTNTDSSFFLKSIDFGTIPRYLLYDKAGKLVHQNAPRPSDPSLISLIKLLL